MSRLKVRFDNPEHGWMDLFIGKDDQEIHRDVSDIFPSLDLLVTALLSMWQGEAEATATWAEEPSELDLVFSRRDESICLEVVPFPGSFRPYSRATLTVEPIFTFVGSYEQTCLPFWRALRELEGRYSSEELAHRWTSPFPQRELAFLTEQLGKD